MSNTDTDTNRLPICDCCDFDPCPRCGVEHDSLGGCPETPAQRQRRNTDTDTNRLPTSTLELAAMRDTPDSIARAASNQGKADAEKHGYDAAYAYALGVMEARLAAALQEIRILKRQCRWCATPLNTDATHAIWCAR